MKIEIVSGFAEYLRPTTVDPTLYLPALGLENETTVVAHARWLQGESALGEHAGTLTSSRRVRLLVEYLADCAPRHGTVVLGLRAESITAPVDGGRAFAELVDTIRRTRFVAEVESVSRVHLRLNGNTDRVLDSLAEKLDMKRPRPSEPDRVALAGCPARIVDIDGQTSTEDAYDAMVRNYSFSVLTLASALVDRKGVFGSEQRGRLIAEHLVRSEFLIRPDVTAEAFEAELEPGAKLYELLTTPVPTREPASAESDDSGTSSELCA